MLDPQLSSTLDSIKSLPQDFHEAGVMQPAVLDALFEIGTCRTLHKSAETGCGKTAMLLSWLSRDHTIFTLERYGTNPCQSFTAVFQSPLLNHDNVRFVLGPTQQTLPQHSFETDLDLVLLDGPHGFPFPCLEYYYFYPKLKVGASLIVDDIHIPSVRMLHDFLLDDDMFELEHTVENTAFFKRTDTPVFNPTGDDWWLQRYNQRRETQPRGSLTSRLAYLLKRR